jgi:hypothetical protein
VWRGHPVESYYYYTHRQTDLWSTQAEGEGIVLKAAWPRCSNSSVVSYPFWEPGRTPLNVGLPSAWDSVDGDHIFPSVSLESFLTGDSYE